MKQVFGVADGGMARGVTALAGYSSVEKTLSESTFAEAMTSGAGTDRVMATPGGTKVTDVREPAPWNA